MRKLSSIAFSILMSAVCLLHAQEKTDTLTAIELNSIQVVSAKPVQLYSRSKSYVIEKAEIHKLPVQNMDELLESVSGFDIRNRSVGGTQADISIRGGSFDQVLVLLNGVNITDPQTGHYNMDIPVELSDIQKIEMLHGSAARVYGPNAFSGVINIVTNHQDKKLNAEITTGSYGTFTQNLNWNFGNNKLNSFASVSHKSSDGYRQNTDYDILNAFSQTQWSTDNVGKFDLQLAYQQKNYGANSFYSFSYPNQFDHTQTFFGALNWDYSYKRMTLNAQAYSRFHYDRFELFRDSISIKPAWYTSHNYHLTNVSGVKATAFLYHPVVNTTFGADIRNEHIYSNALGKLMAAPVENIFDNSHNFTKEYNRLLSTVFLDLSKKTGSFDYSLGASATYNKRYGMLWAGGFEVNYQAAKTTRIFISGNSATRLPTFTDLFIQNSIQKADTNLLPENAKTIETGFRFAHSKLKVNGSIFYRMGKNNIDWVKLPGASKWESKNLADINTLGVDFSADYNFNGKMIKSAGLSYSYLHLDKEAVTFDSKYALDYLRHKAVFSLNHAICKKLSADWQISYNDRAGNYTDFSTGQLMNYQPYFMGNIKVIWNTKHIQIFGTVNNIFDVQYADYGGMEQPGINFMTGIKFTL